MTEGHKVADQEDCGCEGSGTVDELKQISTQTQSFSVARIYYTIRNNTFLNLTYSSPPSFPPKFQKRYQQTPPILASSSLTRYVAALALPGQQSELFLVAIRIFISLWSYHFLLSVQFIFKQLIKDIRFLISEERNLIQGPI